MVHHLCRRVSEVPSVRGYSLTHSPLRRYSIDGILRYTLSIRSQGVSAVIRPYDGVTLTPRQKLLMQFLSVLSMIEGMYSFGRDISAE